MDINNTLNAAAIAFASELRRLRQREGRDNAYGEDKISFSVTVSSGGPQIELSYCKGYSGNIKAASLGALMDEAWRRAGFDDREAGRVAEVNDRLRLALPAPSDTPSGHEVDDDDFSDR